MRKTRIITGMLTGAMVLSLAATAFAAQRNTRVDDSTELSKVSEGELPKLPELANGEKSAFADGEMPELPELPELANGEKPAFADGEMPELPEFINFEKIELSEDERPAFINGEKPAFTEGERPALPDGEQPDFGNGERPSFQGQNGMYIPKLKPENKPDDDMVPPEFEGIEGIERLGRPELGADMYGTTDIFGYGPQFGEVPGDMGGMPGESGNGPQFGEVPIDMGGMPGESGNGPQFGEVPSEIAL